MRALLTMPNYKFTNHKLRFLYLHHHVKNRVDSSIFSWDIADLWILQSHWLRAFWLVTQGTESWICAATKLIIWTFIQHQILKKIKNLIFGYFGPILTIFGQKWIFSKNCQFLDLLLLSIMQNTEKTKELLLKWRKNKSIFLPAEVVSTVLVTRNAKHIQPLTPIKKGSYSIS